MPVIALRQVSLGFEGPPLLSSVDLAVEAGEKIGLIGRNGAGKSTLLRVLEGTQAVESGEVTRQRDLTVAHLEQRIPADAGDSVEAVVRQALEAHGVLSDVEIVSRMDRVLTRVGLEKSTSLEGMSAGGLRRTMLARALAIEPDLLLLDEPTNHLDIEAVQGLEETLAAWRGAFVMVTHDRALLRRTATRILDLDRGNLRSYTCRYEQYLERREAELETEASDAAKLNKELAKEEAWIRRGTKARTKRNQGRVRRLEALRDEKRNLRSVQGQAKGQIEDASRSGQLVYRTTGLTHGYGDQTLISDLDLEIARGDRLGILGPNGCGKTTLLRILLGTLEPDSGQVRVGTNLVVARLDQLPDLDPERSLIENLDTESDRITVAGRTRHVLGYLQDFLFSPERARGPVGHLSGGETKRLQLAKLLAIPCNVLILDEPTNDLDLETLEFLEDILADYDGTVLLVSHDREFLDQVATSVLAFEGNGVIRECAGGYADWERTRPRPGRAAGKSKNKDREARAEPKRKRKLNNNERRELEALPPKIEALEEEREELTTRMADPEIYRGETGKVTALKQRFDAIGEELTTLYARWETLEAIAAGNAE